MSNAFQVDLTGIVDLLARHLYSSPRVYLRELLQNGVDAITARRHLDPSAVGQIRLRVRSDGALEVRDTGIGLTAPQAVELLATIGRSSKRDLELGTGREEYLGQFGIGLLSAFMVADEIIMISKSAEHADASVVRWVGHADGSYELHEDSSDELDGPGSLVVLMPRRDLAHWLELDTVIALAKEFGSLLPIDVSVEVDLPGPDGTRKIWRRLSQPELPWQQEFSTEEQRRAALNAYCLATFGFEPLDIIELSIPLMETSGVAFVLPGAVAPTAPSSHRVYLKRMLLGTRVDSILPDWAFFVRCVLDTGYLRPTASRESLYEDDMLLAARETLGEQVKSWMRTVLSTDDSPRAARFVEVHHLAVRALAIHDDDMLDLAADLLPFETSHGPATVSEFRASHGNVRFTPTVEEFKRVAPVAHAQQLAIINGGYVYDADLLDRLAKRHPEWELRPLDAADVDASLELLPELRERELAGVLASLNRILAPLDCEAALRNFEPAQLPAMLIHDRDGDHQRELQKTVAAKDDLWGEVLAGFAKTAQPRRLVLNCTNEIVDQLLATTDGEIRGAGVQSLYVTALLLAQEPLRGKDAEVMNGSLTTLLRQALGPATERPLSSETDDETPGEPL